MQLPNFQSFVHVFIIAIFAVVLTACNSGGGGSSSNDLPNLIVSNASIDEGNLGTNNLIFTFTLDNYQDVASIDYRTVDGTATIADNDYNQSSGTVTFSGGSTTATISIPVNGDAKFEEHELFTLELSNPANLSNTTSTITGTIINDDALALNDDDQICFETNLGGICMKLFEDVAPKTVQNFLAYITSGSYDNMIFHRSVNGFVLQGGGYSVIEENGSLELKAIPTNDPVENEFQLSNIRGTVAMAKVDGDPDSATNQWFVNLADNSANLDINNGGFTVFGEVVDMTAIDAISAVQTYQLSDTGLDSIPLYNYSNGEQIQLENFIKVGKITLVRKN